jgi:hypothetical protein
VSFTDISGNVQTKTYSTLSAIGDSDYTPYVFKAKQSTTVTISSVTSGSIIYDFGAILELLY